MNPTDRRLAIQIARQHLESNPVFLDTETTGIGPNAEVIEIALIDSQGQLVLESLVKPHGRIESDACRVHGISQEMVQSAPSWLEVWPQAEVVILDHPVGVYNSEFDLRLMKQTHKRNILDWHIPMERFFCIMKLYAQFEGVWDNRRRSYRWHSLEQAGRQCRIPLSNTHHAQDDALLARAVLVHMANWKG